MQSLFRNLRRVETQEVRRLGAEHVRDRDRHRCSFRSHASRGHPQWQQPSGRGRVAAVRGYPATVDSTPVLPGVGPRHALGHVGPVALDDNHGGDAVHAHGTSLGSDQRCEHCLVRTARVFRDRWSNCAAVARSRGHGVYAGALEPSDRMIVCGAQACVSRVNQSALISPEKIRTFSGPVDPVVRKESVCPWIGWRRTSANLYNHPSAVGKSDCGLHHSVLS